MNRSTPGLPVHHQLPESTLTLTLESVMPIKHLILCRPLLLSRSIFPSSRVFSNESALPIRWPKYWSLASTSVLPMNTQDWSPLEWTGWMSLQSKGLTRAFYNTTSQNHQFFGAQLSLWSNSHIHTWLLKKPWPWLRRTFVDKVMSLLFNMLSTLVMKESMTSLESLSSGSHKWGNGGWKVADSRAWPEPWPGGAPLGQSLMRFSQSSGVRF